MFGFVDAASVGLPVRDCKERGFYQMNYASKSIGTLHAFREFQSAFFVGRNSKTDSHDGPRESPDCGDVV